MRLLIIVLLVFHVVPGVFWAGSTFVLARSGGQGVEPLAYPQLGAATVSMIAGFALMGLLHAGVFGTFEQCWHLASSALLLLRACKARAASLPSAGCAP